MLAGARSHPQILIRLRAEGSLGKLNGFEMHLDSVIREQYPDRGGVWVAICGNHTVAGSGNLLKHFRMFRNTVFDTGQHFFYSPMLESKPLQLLLEKMLPNDRSNWTREPVF